MRLLTTVVCLFLSLASGMVVEARAAELRLINGDVISGEFVRRENGRIYFLSPVLGEISVPADQAIVVDPPSTPVESLAGIPPETGATGVSAGPASSQSGNTRWHGTIELGYQQQSGRRESLTGSARALADRTHNLHTFRAEGRMLYGKQNGITNTDRYDSSFRWRYELSERVFAQSLTSYTKDSIKGIIKNWEENLGFGVRLFERPRQSVNIGLGLTAQYREAQGVESGISYLGEAFQDYTYKLSGRLTLIEDTRFLYSLTDRGRQVIINNQVVGTSSSGNDYRFRFNIALQGRVTERVSLNLRYEYEYESAVPDPNLRSDERITTSLGYGF